MSYFSFLNFFVTPLAVPALSPQRGEFTSISRWNVVRSIPPPGAGDRVAVVGYPTKIFLWVSTDVRRVCTYQPQTPPVYCVRRNMTFCHHIQIRSHHPA